MGSIRDRSATHQGSRLPAMLIAAVLSVIISGCVETDTYMAPSATFGEAHPFPPQCGGPPVYLTIRPPNVPITVIVMADESPASFIFLYVDVRVSEGHTLPTNFASGKGHISWANGQATFSLPSLEEGLDSSGGQTSASLPPDDPRRHFMLTSSRYAQSLHIPGSAGHWLEVKLPSILVDSATVDIPPIHFQRKTEKFLLPLNC